MRIVKPLTDHRWEGYTLDQLQEQMALTDARIMLQKKSLMKKAGNARMRHANFRTIAAQVGSLFTVADYVMMAVSLFRRLRKASRRK